MKLKKYMKNINKKGGLIMTENLQNEEKNIVSEIVQNEPRHMGHRLAEPLAQKHVI